MSEINGQTYLEFSGSVIPERDINGNLLSITSSEHVLNEETQFFEVNNILGNYISPYTPATIDKTFSELIFTEESINFNIPSGAVLISESVLLQMEEYIINLESQIILLEGKVEDLNTLTGSLYTEIQDLYDYIAFLLGGGTPTDPQITTVQLPNGKLNIFYSNPLNAVGGVEPYTWSIINGTLPPNLVLDENTGLVSGTPIILYNESITFQVRDFLNNFNTKSVGLTITPELEPLIITTKQTAFPIWIEGDLIDQDMTAAGGIPPYAWGYASQEKLPIELELSLTGNITGRIMESGVYRYVTFKVQDSNNPPTIATKQFLIQVSDA